MNLNFSPVGFVTTNPSSLSPLYSMWYFSFTSFRLKTFTMALGSNHTGPYPGRSPTKLVTRIPALHCILILSFTLWIFPPILGCKRYRQLIGCPAISNCLECSSLMGEHKHQRIDSISSLWGCLTIVVI